MIRRYQVAFFSACLTAMVAWSASAGTKYYVSPSGDDTADGRSKKNAWRTLDRVAQQIFARGDGILLEGGSVHHGSIQLSPNNSTGDIQIGTYDKGRAVIDAGNGPGDHRLEPEQHYNFLTRDPWKRSAE